MSPPTTPTPAGPDREAPAAIYGELPSWHPQRPRLRPLRPLLSWIIWAVAALVAAAILPGLSIPNFAGAVITAMLVAVLNGVRVDVPSTVL